MEYVLFHIWNFPENKVRVLLRNHVGFIDKSTKFFGSQKSLAKFLGISIQLLLEWKKHPLYIPLSSIKKIAIKLRMDPTDIEKNISSYKGKSTGTPIQKPKLPIKQTPEIFELITHIICDGGVNKKGIPFYVNSEKRLINNFDNLLKKIFGKIDTKLYLIRKGNKTCYEYRFPKIVVELLEYFYGLHFYKIKKFPKEVLHLPKEYSKYIIRAFADDEGNVDLNRRIGFNSTNKNLLKVLIRLLRKKLKYQNVSEIMQKDKDYYHFYIKTGDIERYGKEIGFLHPTKKKILNELIVLRNKGNKPGQHSRIGKTRERILKLLSKRTLSTYDLMKKVKINKSNVNLHIKRLINEGFIVQHNKERQTVFWTGRK